MTAILAMEATGLVRRVRNDADRRKQNVFLTAKGRRLKSKLIPLAKEVVNTATTGLSEREVTLFLGFLSAVQRNLEPVVVDEAAESEIDIS
jgi:DNA-binding MarR family transcriptional regulator